MFLIQTYEIEDCKKYDSTQYMLPNNSNGKIYSRNIVNEHISSDFYLSFIGKRTNSNSIWQAGFAIAQDEQNDTNTSSLVFAVQGGHYSSKKGMFYHSAEYRNNGTTTVNREYLYELTVINNDVTFIMTDLTTDMEVYNQTIHITEDLSEYYLQLMRAGDPSWYYRELKYKPL